MLGGALPSSSIKQRGSIMLALLLTAIYRRFLNAALSRHGEQGSKVMAEAVTALCVFSIFLAHAVDAFRAAR